MLYNFAASSIACLKDILGFQLWFNWKHQLRPALEKFWNDHQELPLNEFQFYLKELEDLYNPPELEMAIYWQSKTSLFMASEFETRPPLTILGILGDNATAGIEQKWSLSCERRARLEAFQHLFWNLFQEVAL